MDAASPPSLGFVRVSQERQHELQRRRSCHSRGQAGLQHASLKHPNIPKRQTCYSPRYQSDNAVENSDAENTFW